MTRRKQTPAEKKMGRICDYLFRCRMAALTLGMHALAQDYLFADELVLDVWEKLEAA